MKASKFTDAQKAFIIKQGEEGTTVAEIRTDWRVSIRRACSLIRFDPRTYRYKSRRLDQAAIEQRIKEICQTRVRFGYRRVHVLLRREGWEIGKQLVYGLYCQESLQLRSKRPRRRKMAATRRERYEPKAIDQVWAMDFVSDQLVDET
mgnify:CR=1 FL=1